MKKIAIIVGILIFIVFVCGCIASTTTVEQKHCIENWYDSNSEITKYTIPEDNVTCYVYEDGYSGGISCLRNENT